MYTDLIFDLYGTLVDIHTEEDGQVWEKTALYFGYYGARYTAESLQAAFEEELQQRQAKGLLQSPGGKGRKRSIVTANAARPGQIPVVGVVTAGLPILAVENHEGTMAWDGDPSCFALRVRGDSMINAGILDGDKVVVRPQPTAHEGQIVVARIGDEATVKRISFKNGGVWLLPENPNYEPIDGSEAELIGLVKAVVREY